MQEIITQGTTPVFSFTLPFETAQVKSIFITFRQGEKTVLEKNLSHCSKEEYTLSVTLTQEDTFLLKENQTVCMQARILTEEGKAFASPVFHLRVISVLKGGEIV